MTSTIRLGVDIGGTGIKGAPVDIETGALVAPRHRIPTPKDSTPEAVAAVVAEVAAAFSDIVDPQAPAGVTFPGVVQRGTVRTAANIDRRWIDFPAEELFTTVLGRPCLLVNDADAAGIAEHHHGAAKGTAGLTIVTTLGTGIGVALIHDGVLIPNAELGHLEINGVKAESVAGASAKERDGLSYKKWARRLQTYYSHLEALLWPDLIIVGGGESRRAKKFLPRLDLRTPIVPATLQNTAGIVGAAILAAGPRPAATAP